jgi:hypothetical protein
VVEAIRARDAAAARAEAVAYLEPHIAAQQAGADQLAGG